jgi:trans-2-enoyl-CoA reductase
MAKALAFAFGSSNPIAGLHLVSQALPDCGPRQVVVQFLAVPVNPLDFFVIEGKYPVKLQSVYENEAGETLAIPGSDGAARIIQAGSAVNNLGVGDIVILRTHCRGTWRTQAVFDEEDLIRIPSTIDPRLASLLRMGVAPAYFLLREYQGLEPGDWIIQNAATGTISHFVCQLASLIGVRVISIIRNRWSDEELERTKRSLRSHGASLVLTEDELGTSTTLKGKRIALAIDSVSDDALSCKMATCLIPGATLLTVGFLGAATARPDSQLRQFLWQRNVALKAFRLSDCLGKRNLSQQTALFEWFGDLFARGIIKSPVLEYVRWGQVSEKQLQDAIWKHEQALTGQRKTVLVFED